MNRWFIVGALGEQSRYKSILDKYPRFSNVLKILVEDKFYTPIDKLARALNTTMVRTALYEALRYAITEVNKNCEQLTDETEKKKCIERKNMELPDENEINNLLKDIERDLSIAQQLALIALAKR